MIQIILASQKGMMSHVLCLLYKVISPLGKTVPGPICTHNYGMREREQLFELKFKPDTLLIFHRLIYPTSADPCAAHLV